MAIPGVSIILHYRRLETVSAANDVKRFHAG
jgi:hypothetical protein